MQVEPKLRIAIECRIGSVQQGIGTVVLSLAQSLSELGSSDQEYHFLVSEEMVDWLAPHVFGPSRLVVRSALSGSRWKTALRRFEPFRLLVRRMRGGRVSVPVSDGFVEQQGFDLIHFPSQVAYRTRLPSIYQPWDLQHLHYPEFFSAEDVSLRELFYRSFCQQATAVCVTSEWTRQDLVSKYELDERKISVIRWGTLFSGTMPPAAAITAETVRRLGLPKNYFFYPAATWPHKNHNVLLYALRDLKLKHGKKVALCLTGAKGSEHAFLMKLARELNVDELIHELGFVSAEDLRSLYAGAQAMVFPSKFEGFGLPILEAFQMGTPVLSSSATVLPETGREGAAYFDADSPEELAALMLRVSDEPDFRRNLVELGWSVLARSSMEETARGFQNLYRRVHASTSDNESDALF